MAKNIHMDVDSVRAVLELLEKERDRLQKSIKSTSGAVIDLEQGDWFGNSADRFFDEYNEMLNTFRPRLDAMEAFAGRLWQAIADFEAAAAKLD